jgi:hypothetical protein
MKDDNGWPGRKETLFLLGSFVVFTTSLLTPERQTGVI